MIVHIALYKWQSGTGAEDIANALTQIRVLKDKVPGIIDVRCGENFSEWGEGYTHAIVVLAEDEAALQAYRDHPDHLRAAHDIKTIETAGIGVDFEDNQ